MGTFILFIVIGLILFFGLKKFSPDMLDEHSRKRKDSTKRIIEAEHEKARLYDEHKKHDAPSITVFATMKSSTQIVETEGAAPSSRRTPADNLRWLLEDGEKVIEVDAELIFTKPYFKDQRYLHATHYFPEREEVFGTNENGKILWVDLHNQKEATKPDTGERIPGIKKYLRSNAV